MKLFLLAPCEKVIQDQESGNSLISLFHAIHVSLPVGAETPPHDAVIPRQWAIFGTWELSPEEEGSHLTGVFEVFWPDGRVFTTMGLETADLARSGVAFILRLHGFPLGQNGDLRITHWLERDGAQMSEKSETQVTVSVVIGSLREATSEMANEGT